MYIVCFMSLNFRLILYRCHTCPFPCVVATISSMTVTKRPFLFRKSLPPAAGMRMGMSDRSQKLRCRAGLWEREDVMFGCGCITFHFPSLSLSLWLTIPNLWTRLRLGMMHVDSASAGDDAPMLYPISMFYRQRHTMDNALKGSRQSTIGQDWGTG